MTSKSIFVTVGTTNFDDLIKIITRNEVLKALNEKGYNHLVLQIGNTSLDPDCTPRCGFKTIESFHLNSSLQKYVSFADLIISHAGAGSCLEALEAKKPLIVVTNQLLMDNHQLELAEQLYKDGYIYYCTCDTLLNLLQTMNLVKLKPFTSDKSRAIANLIDEIMGFN